MIKRYIIEVDDDYEQKGKMRLSRTNSGFDALELLGVLEHAQLDVLRQMAGEIRPSIVERVVVAPGNTHIQKP